jgi:hypothetical protein
MSSVTIGRPVRAFASARRLEAGLPQAVEGVRARARLVGAAAQHGRAAGQDVVGGGEELVARLDGARARR